MGRIDESINRAKARKRPQPGQPGPPLMTPGNYLAIVCLSLGAALAAFVPGSLEPRLGNLFFFGLMPALGFSAGGYVLGQLLVFGVKLCDKIMVRCTHYAVHLANVFINRAGAHVSNWL